jgi:hypothetical protein
MTNYQIAKSTLKTVSLDAKQQHKDDKPLVRMIINDTADSVSRDLNLSDHERNLLANYACKLHPKK